MEENSLRPQRRRVREFLAVNRRADAGARTHAHSSANGPNPDLSPAVPPGLEPKSGPAMSRREQSAAEIKAGFSKSKQSFINQSLHFNLQLNSLPALLSAPSSLSDLGLTPHPDLGSKFNQVTITAPGKPGNVLILSFPSRFLDQTSGLQR